MSFGLGQDSMMPQRRQFQVPHPPVSLALFLTLEEAITVAWRWLHSEPWDGFDSKTATEVDYTAQLRIVLGDHLLDSGAVGGFDGEAFRSIERIETVNFDGSKKSKRPDLVAFLFLRANTQQSQDGIFIECKPVDAAHSLLTDYCDKGISRFIDGDYAWAMIEALMLGYNSVHSKPSEALVKPIGMRPHKYGIVGKPRDCGATPCIPQVAITKHKRSFRLKGEMAGAITLRHLWLPDLRSSIGVSTGEEPPAPNFSKDSEDSLSPSEPLNPKSQV